MTLALPRSVLKPARSNRSTRAARSARSTRSTPVVLLLGLAGAVALRVGIGGPAGVRDPWAGLAFAVVLTGLALAAGLSPRPGDDEAVRRVTGTPGRRWATDLAAGTAAAAVLCAVPLVVHLRTPGGALDPAGLPVWAVVVTTVAVAEEAFLRGALWTALARTGGTTTALIVTTVAFGLLHVPFYGIEALPLDLAVGLLLGGLRMLTGRWAAPAVAHTLADLAGWWLR